MAVSRLLWCAAACAIIGASAPTVTYAQDAATLRADAPADGPWFANHEMPVSADGNLPGELRVFDESGNLVPARVRLFFLQQGEIVTQTRPDDQGNFQAVGLIPGVYSVVAAGPEGFGAFSVRVLPATEPVAPPKTNTISDERLREVSFTNAAKAYASSLQASVLDSVNGTAAIQIGAEALGVSTGGAVGGSLGASLASDIAGGIAGGSSGAIGALGAAGGLVGALAGSNEDQPAGTGTTDTTQSANTTGS